MIKLIVILPLSHYGSLVAEDCPPHVHTEGVRLGRIPVPEKSNLSVYFL